QNFDHFQDSTVRLGDHLYTAIYGGLTLCVEWRTGKVLWGPVRTVGRGKVAITYADQRLYLLYSDGACVLADASPEAFQIRGKFRLPDHAPSIGATSPVITRGRMYVHDNDRLLCYD